MQIEDRLHFWDIYRNRAIKFWGDVEDDINYHFAPVHASQADDDTPYVRKLFDMLADINGFISEHIDSLENQFSKWEDEHYEELHQDWVKFPAEAV